MNYPQKYSYHVSIGLFLNWS